MNAVEGQEAKGWISVRKRLPACPSANGLWLSVPVIICRAGQVRGAYYVHGRGFFTDEGLGHRGVTHWIPMPAAPSKTTRKA